MEKFYIPSTSKTPEIFADPSLGSIVFRGRSIPENATEFYQSLAQWLGEYLEHPPQKTVVDVCLEYFNTSSSKALVEVFRLLEPLKRRGGEVLLRWHFEEGDEDMRESGEDFRQVLALPLVFCEVEELG